MKQLKAKTEHKFSSLQNSKTMAEQNKKPRHPKFAIPKRYDLKLKTVLSAGKFAGAVQISVSVVSDTKYLVLDAVGLSVNPNSVSFASKNKVMKAVRVELQAKEEKVVVEFKEKLPIGFGFLSMEFEGTLNPRIKGFITSIFKDNNGETVETKSMPAGARWCFPCWDEPHYLASLKMTIEVVASGWEGRIGEGLWWIVAALFVANVAFRGILRPPGGYWQEHFSDHPERMGRAVMAYTRPVAFHQYIFFNCVAFNSAIGVLMLQLGWFAEGCGRVRRAQMVLLWISITALMLSRCILLFDMRPMVSLPVWLGLVALGLYAMLKHGYVEEKEGVV